MQNNVIFREYDIRGVYETDFDLQFARYLGQALASYIYKKSNATGSMHPRVCVGYDARLSSPSIAAAVTHGLKMSGVHVINLGLVTTPVCYFSTFKLPDIHGAIQITGSHNPPEYNGFKISYGSSSLFGTEILALKKIIEDNDFVFGEGSEESFDIRPTYYQHHAKEFGKLRNIPIVLDCGNGAAGSVVRNLFAAVGLEPIILFEEPDGRFPNHHPDPTVEKNLKHLKEKVLETRAICGIGFDGDADRIGVVDHQGRMLFGDEFMTIIARDILSLHPQSKIIGDVKCSDRMFADIQKHNGIPIMWKTGHSLVKEKIKTEKSPFGGEMSGHIFFADRNFGYDDAPYAALRLIEILCKTSKNLPQLLEGLPPAYSTPEIRIDTTEEKKLLIVEKVKSAFSKPSMEYKINLTDGIRISFNDGWALCRSSNTQPVLVLRYESETAEGLERIQKTIEAIVQPLL